MINRFQLPQETIWVSTPDGVGLGPLLSTSTRTKLVANGVSITDLVFEAPDRWTDRLSMLRNRDALFRIWRDGRLLGQKTWLVRESIVSSTQDGFTQLKVRGLCTTSLLERRLVLSPSGSIGASKSGFAESVLKEFADEAFGPAASVDRQMPITITADQGRGASISLSASYDNLLATCQAIAGLSWQEGVPLYFDVVSSGMGLQLSLEIYLGQRGVDRSQGLNTRVFRDDSPEISNVSLTSTYDGEITSFYVGGAGQESERFIGNAQNGDLIGGVPFGLIEDFTEATNLKSQVEVDARAGESLELSKMYPKLKFTLKESPRFRYGFEWGWGDKIRFNLLGHAGTGIIETLILNRSGDDSTIEADLSVIV